MDETSKNLSNIKLSAAIAGGIFGGLLAYKLLTAALDWYASGWSEITQQQQLLLTGAFISLIVVGVILLPRLRNRYLQIASERRIRQQIKADEFREQREREAANAAKAHEFVLQNLLEDLRRRAASPYLKAQTTDPHAQRILLNMAKRQTNELIEILIAGDKEIWTTQAREIARDVLTARAGTQEFADGVEEFRKSILLPGVA